MVFIHKLAHPRCFPKTFHPNSLVSYYSNNTTWMNRIVFTTWIKSVNHQMALAGVTDI
jgi:hypothetical protein